MTYWKEIYRSTLKSLTTKDTKVHEGELRIYPS